MASNITQLKEGTECLSEETNRRHIGETEEGWGSGRLRKPPVHHTGTRRSCSSYMKVLLAKKKKFEKRSRHSCFLFFSFSFTHSVYFPFSSPSPFLSSPSLQCLTYTYTHFPPTLHFFLLSTSLSPFLHLPSSFSQSPSALPLFRHATPFWERTGSQPRLLLARVVSRQIKYG